MTKNETFGPLLSRSERPAMSIRSILVPLDFSETSAKALRYAAALAEEFQAKIDLLYVMEPVSLPEFAGAYPGAFANDELVTACKRNLAKSANECEVNGELIAELRVRRGPPHREIIDAARELNADLIVIGTHGYSGLQHVMVGSVTERVVRSAPCPVLVVREKEHDFVAN